jgi:alpha-beta hydrolase superfamily lysophospholipase
MKRLYAYVAVGILIVAALIVSSFVVFEKEKHLSLFYSIEVAGSLVGYVEVDRYKTEEKTIYRATAFYPKALDRETLYEKIIFNRRGFELDRYVKEVRNFQATIATLFVKNNRNGTLDIVSRYASAFSTVSGIPRARDISVFDNRSIVTYIPFVDKYDFNKGGAQSFNALFHLLDLVPPAQGKVIFTSIRDDYIQVNGKKTKTECLVVKAKTLPQGFIWVSKKDRTIAQMKLEPEALVMKRIDSPPTVTYRKYAVAGQRAYDTSEILIPSGDIALAGTVMIPRGGEPPFPCVLLCVGAPGFDRENAGLYTDIGHELAQSGFVVLMYDKRGIGSSQGDNMSVSLDDEIGDIESALRFLAGHEMVDRERIFIVAHSVACSLIPRLDFASFPVRGLALLAPSKPALFFNDASERVEDIVQGLIQIDRRFPETLRKLQDETRHVMQATKKDHIFLNGERVFTKRMKALAEFDPLDGFADIVVPFLLVQGKKDEFGSAIYSKEIIDTVRGAGFQRFHDVYFRELGHTLGDVVNAGDTVTYYKIDREVAETVRDWMRERCKQDVQPEQTDVPDEEEGPAKTAH